MNFNFLRLKNDKHLILNNKVKSAQRKLGGDKYLSLEYLTHFNLNTDVELLEFVDWHKTFEFLGGCCESGVLMQNKGRRTVEVISELVSQSGEVFSKETTLLAPGSSEELQYPLFQKNTSESINLKVRLKLEKYSRIKLRFLNYRIINHDSYIRKLTGEGLELGPGHNPKIKHENVKYLEKYELDEWKSANIIKNDTALDFSKYILGEAHELPSDNNSLDFIFSSHVFEHLFNPIGHLRHWRTKLKQGGKVAAVVPGIYGAKDYFAKPSTLEKLIVEDSNGSFEIPLESYQYYNDIREWKVGGLKLMQEKRSIHVHFYDKYVITSILDFAVKELGFESYFLDYSRNHKDFYFELVK